ncbi:MAG: hypothetical protein QG597_3059, partial [Actinomycetota bacterium]|nr:hypothetical protein [Actinomycetota bacterium]
MVTTAGAFLRVVIAVSVAASLGLMAPGASAATSAKAKAGTAATVSIVAPDVLRIDKQVQGTPLVVFSGIDSQTKVRVNFGDEQYPYVRQGRCKISSAVAYPQNCTLEMAHEYYKSGTYTITAIVGTTKVQKLITITPPPVRWTPPAGWVQPAGWSVLGRGAWYHACQNVEWYV